MVAAGLCDDISVTPACEHVFVTVMDDLERVVDAVVGDDVATMGDAAVRATFLALRRRLDRLDAFASSLLATMHGRGIWMGDGAASTRGMGAVANGSAVNRREGLPRRRARVRRPSGDGQSVVAG